MKGKNTYKVTEIIQNATVIYTDNVKERFEALRVINKGVVIGRVLDDEFVDCGFISKVNIKEIKDGVKKKVTIMKA